MRFIPVNVYIGKDKSFKINNLNFQLKKLEKEQTKSQSQKKVRKYEEHKSMM